MSHDSPVNIRGLKPFELDQCTLNLSQKIGVLNEVKLMKEKLISESDVNKSPTNSSRSPTSVKMFRQKAAKYCQQIGNGMNLLVAFEIFYTSFVVCF